MDNFTYYNPTQAVFGKGQLSQLNDLVPPQAKVLITYGGGSVKRLGTLDQVKEELVKSERTVLEFGGIEANPQFETAMKAVEIARSEGIDFLLAVGGGSVMDATKFIALAASSAEHVGKEKELMYHGFAPVPVQSAIAIGTVVTLPATGSEMNGFSVISDGHEKLPIFSPLTFPTFSILDPELTFTLPEHQVANGVVDTFVHVLEQYITYPVDARFQDRVAEGILQTLIEVGPKTLAEPEDYSARANLVWCANHGSQWSSWIRGASGLDDPYDRPRDYRPVRIGSCTHPGHCAVSSVEDSEREETSQTRAVRRARMGHTRGQRFRESRSGNCENRSLFPLSGNEDHAYRE